MQASGIPVIFSGEQIFEQVENRKIPYVFINGWRRKQGSFKGEEAQNYMRKSKEGICCKIIHYNIVQRPVPQINRQLYQA